ncbi:glutathione peroxidase [Kaistia dalseonensis]|uniref:Glutathione peroxidase n=1 Tax=Kaistia dalseonensis TaxID=410840 RepID=A0ABU0HBE5_9HYPH|nr:glutathione peroxidase [Kaistia dalseonensis]MCX5497003.1 glutathione peroxidase [Kaistia dalseonensis]MDQ0439629.1 glutathione peroxidase [Kaistia dalseonensis]
MPSPLYEIPVARIDGSETSLGAYAGNVLLVVNVASKCGLTPQYDGLEALYRKYKDEGLTVVGFPANNFAGQEPGTNAEIAEFCRLTYGVDFPMFAKISVKGEDRHPLYDALAGSEDISWNFEKFLIGRNGEVAARFSPKTVPEDPAVVTAIEQELAKG